MKKILATAVCMILASAVLFAGGGKESAGANKKIRVLSSVSGGKTPEENKLFQEALSKATGLDIEWELISSDYDKVIAQKLSAGEAYDLIYFTIFNMYIFIDQGVLMDITKYIDNSKVYKDNVPKEQLDIIKFKNKYYAGFNKLELYPLPSVNKVMTDQAGINLANLKTLDDYYNMLKAVKADQEKTKKPFYPMFVYMTDIWDLQPWFSSVGLKRGVQFDSSGKKYSPWATAQAKPVWDWLVKLYQEGLIDPESFTGRTGDMRNKQWNQQTALTSDWAAWVGLKNLNARNAGTYPDKVHIVGLPGTLSPSGKYMLEQGQPSLWGIPVTSKNPDAAFKIIEYFATNEGGLLLSAGIEGYDYTVQNGTIVFTEEGKKHANDHGAPFPISKNFDMAKIGPLNPGVQEAIDITKKYPVELDIMQFANGQLPAPAYYKIMSKWLGDAMQGRVTVDAAIKGAQDELRAAKIID